MPQTRTRPGSAPEPPQQRPTLARTAALAALLFFACAPFARAQVPGSSAPAQQAEAAAEPHAIFASPRDVVRAYLDAIAARRIDLAAQVFDLSAVPAAQRRARGADHAQRLARILDHVAKLDPDEFPSAAEVEGQDAWELTLHPPGHPDVEVRLGFAAQASGGWLFDRGTVAEIASSWADVRDLPLIEDSGRVLTLPELVRQRVPARLKGDGFLLEPYQWIGLAVLVLLGVVLDRIVTFLLRPVVRRASQTDGLTIDKQLLADFERPIGALVTVLAFVAGLRALDLDPRTREALELAASFVLAVAGVWATYRLVDVLCWVLAQRAARTENTFDDMLVPLLRRTLKVFVIVVGIVYVASKLTGDLWHLVAGLSIGSLAVGFAAKDSIENLFGTFTVLLDKPFKLGDKIRVSGLEGVVEDVGFRSTRLRTGEDSLITIPNSRFIASEVDNLGSRRSRRIRTLLGLTYDTPPEKIDAFCEGVRELVRRHPLTLKRDYFVGLHAFNSSSLDVFLQVHFDVPNDATEWRERHRLYADILRLSKSLGVSFAFPTQTQHLVSPEELEHKDAPATSAAGVEVGRARAQEIAHISLAPLEGARPPPVRFESLDPEAPPSEEPQA